MIPFDHQLFCQNMYQRQPASQCAFLDLDLSSKKLPMEPGSDLYPVVPFVNDPFLGQLRLWKP